MSYNYIKNYRQRTKQKLVDLMGGKCQSCGYDKCINALEFHHTDPTKKDFAISSAGLMNWDKTFSEAQKCILICANCHREIHCGVRECPKENSINYEKLSQRWIEWDKINLEKELESNTIDEISIMFDIPINTLRKECRKRKIDSSKIRKEDKRKNKLKFEVSKKELAELVKEKPFTEIGKMFGVSDNAVRKRCKKLEIEIPKNRRGYWSKLQK